MKPFTVKSSSWLVDVPFCRLEAQQVELPDGSNAKWYIRHAGPAVIIVPQLNTGEILLQRSYKHGCGQIITELPAGLVDAHEAPIKAAQRELLEETGYQSDHWTELGSHFSDPTGSTMRYHFWLAQDCQQITDPDLEPEEQIETFPVQDLATAIAYLQESSNKGTVSALLGLMLASRI
jgi:ADP-ribose pyrophosphatase